MADFQFVVTSGTASTAGTLTGTMGAAGPAFTFSFNAPLAIGNGSDIAITSAGSSSAAWSGTFAFTNPSDFFSNFQLNGVAGSATALNVVTTGAPTAQPAMFGAPFVGNVVSL